MLGEQGEHAPAHVYGRLHHRGGLMLAARGYYQSLRLIPPIFGGPITVVDALTSRRVL